MNFPLSWSHFIPLLQQSLLSSTDRQLFIDLFWSWPFVAAPPGQTLFVWLDKDCFCVFGPRSWLYLLVSLESRRVWPTQTQTEEGLGCQMSVAAVVSQSAHSNWTGPLCPHHLCSSQREPPPWDPGPDTVDALKAAPPEEEETLEWSHSGVRK